MSDLVVVGFHARSRRGQDDRDVAVVGALAGLGRGIIGRVARAGVHNDGRADVSRVICGEGRRRQSRGDKSRANQVLDHAVNSPKAARA